ncbi:hypothetical protein KU43P_31440 [Pseudomonas sp. KU43P]|nr:hypothetical protein KU43P_31440 [Pseudomonas sp. KU43P]
MANIQCPWLLEASDFNTKDDLKKFIFSTLVCPNGRDQFTNVMESAFRSNFPEDFEPFQNLKSKFLYLNLAPENLAALRIYLSYEETNSHTANDLKQERIGINEISVHDLKMIARMIQSAVENPVTTGAERSIRTNLQGNSFEELMGAWHKSTLVMQKWKIDGVHPKITP